MSREKRLVPILQMAQKKVDEASRALGYLNQKIAEEEQTRKQLKNYESEYMQLMRGGDTPGRPVNIQAMMRYQAFIQRLELAQIQQQQQISLLEQQKQQVTQHWIQVRAKAQAVEKVMVQLRNEEALIAARAEQKMLDELSSLKNYARRSY
ncbi:flagellar export protein FliJ [Marinospirillum sp. MEB164]|uniref:Flagellar FliJ protein n=1 Tax=Marinospirillum alkalitolerans TaxID=3123374 RepID=A0ABW8PTZ1_9GAMM